MQPAVPPTLKLVVDDATPVPSQSGLLVADVTTGGAIDTGIVVGPHDAKVAAVVAIPRNLMPVIMEFLQSSFRKLRLECFDTTNRILKKSSIYPNLATFAS